jgi:hypothetical protein
MTYKSLWAASDGSGGYDIGEGSYTLAHVRDIKREDGRKVFEHHKSETGHEHDARELAMLMRAAPDLLKALERMVDLFALEHERPCEGFAAQDYNAAIEAIRKAKG